MARDYGDRGALRSGVVVDPGMCVNSLLWEPGGLVSGRAASPPRRSVSGR